VHFGVVEHDFTIWFGAGNRHLLVPTTESPMTNIRTGPRTLSLMSADQVAALDPYMAQIITYRISGRSLNHIIGCRWTAPTASATFGATSNTRHPTCCAPPNLRADRVW
jgi:hypothetical protein